MPHFRFSFDLKCHAFLVEKCIQVKQKASSPPSHKKKVTAKFKLPMDYNKIKITCKSRKDGNTMMHCHIVDPG
jgi:hypothetical protein